MIKKLEIQDFINVPPSGIIYSKLNIDDEIVDVQIVSDNLDLIIYSDNKALRVSSKDVCCLKRNTIGTLAMGGSHGDLKGMSIIYPDAAYVIVVTESGCVNKFLISGFERKARNKPGSGVIKLGKNDKIFKIYGADDHCILKISTAADTIDIPISNIPSGSSISAGTKMVSTKSDIILEADISTK